MLLMFKVGEAAGMTICSVKICSFVIRVRLSFFCVSASFSFDF